MEAQPRTPEAPIETRDEQADIADATVAASTEPITLGLTIASSSQQVTSHEPILNQPITLLIYLAPKTNSDIPTELQHFRFALLRPGINGSDCPRSEGTTTTAAN